MLLHWFLRRRTLGPVIWSSVHPGRGFVYLWSLAAAFKIGDMVSRSKQAGPFRPATDFMMAFIWTGLAYQALFPKGLVRIHQRGLTVGMLALQWAEVTAWSWGAAGEVLSVTTSPRP